MRRRCRPPKSWADNALGSLEAGKIANVVVATGDPFAEDTALRHVFVDGKLYNIPEATTAEDRPRGETSGEERGSRTEREPIVKPGGYITEGPSQTLIKNGTILTITNGTIENGDVLIRDGKIVAVGPGLPPHPERGSSMRPANLSCPGSSTPIRTWRSREAAP